jgi:hypothetical protein
VSWPPPRPRRRRVPPRPWDPKHPKDPKLKADAERLLYIVVDEIVGDWVGLSVSPWPDADPAGRLRFRPDLAPLEVGTNRETLRRFLRSGVFPRRAEVKVGMVFAARVKEGTAERLMNASTRTPDHAPVERRDLAEWLERPCDLSKQARVVARLAYYAAMLSTIPKELEDRWNIE